MQQMAAPTLRQDSRPMHHTGPPQRQLPLYNAPSQQKQALSLQPRTMPRLQPGMSALPGAIAGVPGADMLREGQSSSIPGLQEEPNTAKKRGKRDREGVAKEDNELGDTNPNEDWTRNQDCEPCYFPELSATGARVLGFPIVEEMDGQARFLGYATRIPVVCCNLQGTYLEGCGQVQTQEGRHIQPEEFCRIAGGIAKDWATSIVEKASGDPIGTFLARRGRCTRRYSPKKGPTGSHLADTSTAPQYTQEPRDITECTGVQYAKVEPVVLRCVSCIREDYDRAMVQCSRCRHWVHGSCIADRHWDDGERHYSRAFVCKLCKKLPQSSMPIWVQIMSSLKERHLENKPTPITESVTSSETDLLQVLAAAHASEDLATQKALFSACAPALACRGRQTAMFQADQFIRQVRLVVVEALGVLHQMAGIGVASGSAIEAN